MSILGRDRPWTDKERSAALAAITFEEFAAQYPRRTRDSWRLKRDRMRAGTSPKAGDARIDKEARAALAALHVEPPSHRRPPVKHPHGWEPGIEFDGKMGRLSSGPLEKPGPDWSALLRRWELDPERFEIIEPVQMRTWDAAVGNGEVRTMWYYRADVRARTIQTADLDELIAEVRSHVPVPRPPRAGHAFITAPADWQLGKEGTEATVARIMADIDAIEARIIELRSIGRRIGSLYLTLMGDLFESCDGHYAMQTFKVELDRRSQIKLGRRLIVSMIERLAPMVDRMIVAAVAGNHGEHRKDGQAFTSFGDNDDLAVVEQVADILAANPAVYGHVSFVIPDNELTIALDVEGTVIGLAHGHQAKGGGATTEQKTMAWWKGQDFGRRPVADADILIVGHNHHFAMVQEGPRLLVQCPSLEERSQWFEETSGKRSPSGTVTFLAGAGGWSDLQLV